MPWGVSGEQDRQTVLGPYILALSVSVFSFLEFREIGFSYLSSYCLFFIQLFLFLKILILIRYSASFFQDLYFPPCFLCHFIFAWYLEILFLFGFLEQEVLSYQLWICIYYLGKITFFSLRMCVGVMGWNVCAWMFVQLDENMFKATSSRSPSGGNQSTIF